jgi:hypothetical protein
MRAFFLAFFLVFGLALGALADDTVLVAGERYEGVFSICTSYQGAKSLKKFVLHQIVLGKTGYTIPSTIDCYRGFVAFEPVALDPSLQSKMPIIFKDPNGRIPCPSNNGERCRVEITLTNFFWARFLTTNEDR